MIKKFLKKFLTQLTSPTAPAFNSDTKDVLMNPDVFVSRTRKDKIIPSFKSFNVKSKYKKKKEKAIEKPKIQVSLKKIRNKYLKEKLDKIKSMILNHLLSIPL